MPTRRTLLAPVLPRAQGMFLRGIADPAPPSSLEVHAANRLMYGPRPGDVEAIASVGYDAFLQQQLDPASIDDSEADAIREALPHVTFSETWAQLYDRRNNPVYSESILALTETRHRTWASIRYSRRQLFERMVHFWHDHFSIHGFQFIVRSMFSRWDETIRQHAFGNFREFLEATATHPCMLYYLDNYISTNAGPNENYARELFELHTLGDIHYQVPGGYIDQDVYEASRCFTGWTFDTGSTSATRGQFVYVHESHDRFIKYVLEQFIPGDQAPLKDGRDVLDLLANHIGTARHVAAKLCRRFVSDDPSPALVESVAQVFHSNRTQPDQIRRTVEHLLDSDEFRNARANKFKRPVFWTASLMRALEMPYPTSDSFLYLFNDQGQPWFDWRSPDGAPDTHAYWATSNGLLQRWNFIFQLVSGWYTDNGIPIPTLGLAPPELRTAREIAQWWATRIVGRPLSTVTEGELVEFVADGRNPDLELPDSEIAAKNQYVGALCAMTPEFMRH